jgi:hypothetical protein
MRAGRGNIGKVEIDCRFMFTKSHWGVIGESKNPAGILYLDLDFSQPPDCKLESATITVTLTEDDGEESRIQPRSACPVQFTDHYGPKCVRGPESLVQTRRTKNRTPEVQLFGYGAGGLGIDKEKSVQTKGRWDFSGYISSTKESIWYNRLRWELKENSLEWQPTHSNLFHTAFALEHNATRFYMTVHVSGKLAKLSDKLKSRLKFGEKGSKDQEIVTKIEWAEAYSCPLRLDPIAQHLHEAMGYENMTKVPVEIPGALAASYHPAITNHVPPPVPTQPPRPNMQQLPGLRPSLAASGLPASVGGAMSTLGHPMQHFPALTLEDLSMAAAGFANGPPHSYRPPLLSTSGPAGTDVEVISDSSSSVTLVNSAVPTQIDGESTSGPVSDTGQKDLGEEIGPGSNGDGIWLGVTAMLLHWFGTVGVLLLGLAGAMGLRSKRKPGSSKPRKENRSRNKAKTVEFDGASESSRIKSLTARPVYPVRGRLRGRRGQRPLYLGVDAGKRRAQGWEDIPYNAGRA